MDALIRWLSAAVAALTGGMVMYGLTRLHYFITLAEIRRIQPGARLCSFDFDAMALWLMPLGAVCMILVSEIFLARIRRVV